MITLDVIEHVRVGRLKHTKLEGELGTDVLLLGTREAPVLGGVPTVLDAGGKRHSGTVVDFVSLSPPDPLCSGVC